MNMGKYAIFLSALFVLYGCSDSYDPSDNRPHFVEYPVQDDNDDKQAETIFGEKKRERQRGYWDSIDDLESPTPAATPAQASGMITSPAQTEVPESDANKDAATDVKDDTPPAAEPAPAPAPTPAATPAAANTPAPIGRAPRPVRQITHPVNPGRSAGRPPQPRPAASPARAAVPAASSGRRACMENEKVVKMNSGGFACCPAGGDVCYPLLGREGPRCQGKETLTQMNSGEMACCPPGGEVCYPAR